MTFKIVTFGCRLNQAESEKISADLILAGFQHWSGRRQNFLAPSGKHVQNSLNSPSDPSLIILNICAVTHKAVREARQKVAQLKRKFPKSKIIVTGCIDEWNWKEVDFWIENRHKNKLLKLLKTEIRNWKPASPAGELEIRQDKTKKVDNQRVNSRIRTFIKIQDGCDNFCAYCIVPLMRGKPKSRGIAEIIRDIQDKENQGFKEVVLTGVNIGLYAPKGAIKRGATDKNSHSEFLSVAPLFSCRASGRLGLIELLEIILNNTNIPRIRLSSLWPTHLTPKLINLIAKNPRICPHIHLSIQSGSDKILKSMGRHYTVKDIIKITNQAKTKIPKINFTSDFIVGFPGETDQDFQDSCQLVEKVGFSKVHVFKYSKRPKTKAAKMSGQIQDKIKQARSRELIKQAEIVAKKTKDGFLGQEFDILWEGKKAGFWYGFTDNYIRVKKKVDKRGLRNKIEKVILNKNLLV